MIDEGQLMLLENYSFVLCPFLQLDLSLGIFLCPLRCNSCVLLGSFVVMYSFFLRSRELTASFHFELHCYRNFVASYESG